MNRKYKKELSGNRYGILTVQRFAYIKDNKSYWECLCDCGKIAFVPGNNLKSGNTKSCGCLRHRKKTNAYARDNPRLHSIWAAMKARCYNKSVQNYFRYGGRGIKVCDEWLSFDQFYKWAISSGYKEDAPFSECSIDRIDNNGDYSPENCRWVDYKTQAANTRRNRKITINGVTKNATDWEREYGLPYKTISNRTRRGWTEEEAVLTPLGGRRCLPSQSTGQKTN